MILTHDAAADNDMAAAKARRDDRRVQLSFIGHSMGGYVVTNAIRTLTDLFSDDASLRPHIDVGVFNAENTEKAPAKIGRALRLTRFALASPDIPAEALLSNRANFLASSLRRFDEAYLFSSEGDEVLRQISTLANYFSFPTTSWKFGFRLGNVDILSKGYGIIDIGHQSLASVVRVGYLTLDQIYRQLRSARGEEGREFLTLQNRLPEKFSYFDCTDYIEPDAAGHEVGLLTFALRTKRHNATARMPVVFASASAVFLFDIAKAERSWRLFLWRAVGAIDVPARLPRLSRTQSRPIRDCRRFPRSAKKNRSGSCYPKI